ncbi:hypothetical protein XENORESO_001513 [Xenotaenia resolanae]|uniref:Uncharacterized protein n=1 Tax=Xenotaenia resolanae TaxID=208358 RepID=A0ABV0VU52_9TELE
MCLLVQFPTIHFTLTCFFVVSWTALILRLLDYVCTTCLCVSNWNILDKKKNLMYEWFWINKSPGSSGFTNMYAKHGPTDHDNQQHISVYSMMELQLSVSICKKKMLQ